MLASTAIAQEDRVMQLVKRVVPVKEYTYSNEFLLEINAEKAHVEIKVVSGNTAKLYLEQSATNVDVRIAKRELSYCHFIEKKERDRLFLNNYIQMPAGSKRLSSIINNKYVIEIPAHCHLMIKNELGEVSVKGLKTSINCNLEYSSLTLEDSDGKLYVNSQIGDVNIINSRMNGEMILENISLKLFESGGSYDILSQFGSISCTMSEQMSLFNADVEHCEVTLINRTSLDFNYAITTNNAYIGILDEILKEKLEKGENKETLRMKSDNSAGTIIIKSNYSDVNLY